MRLRAFLRGFDQDLKVVLVSEREPRTPIRQRVGLFANRRVKSGAHPGASLQYQLPLEAFGFTPTCCHSFSSALWVPKSSAREAKRDCAVAIFFKASGACLAVDFVVALRGKKIEAVEGDPLHERIAAAGQDDDAVVGIGADRMEEVDELLVGVPEAPLRARPFPNGSKGIGKAFALRVEPSHGRAPLRDIINASQLAPIRSKSCKHAFRESIAILSGESKGVV